MNFEVGQIVALKKPHPCGTDKWIILRVGADFRIKCQKCGHMIMLTRAQFLKSIKKGGIDPPPE